MKINSLRPFFLALCFFSLKVCHAYIWNPLPSEQSPWESVNLVGNTGVFANMGALTQSQFTAGVAVPFDGDDKDPTSTGWAAGILGGIRHHFSEENASYFVGSYFMEVSLGRFLGELPDSILGLRGFFDVFVKAVYPLSLTSAQETFLSSNSKTAKKEWTLGIRSGVSSSPRYQTQNAERLFAHKIGFAMQFPLSKQRLRILLDAESTTRWPFQGFLYWGAFLDIVSSPKAQIYSSELEDYKLLLSFGPVLRFYLFAKQSLDIKASWTFAQGAAHNLLFSTPELSLLYSFSF